MANTLVSDLRDEVVFRVTPDNSTDTTSSARIVARINWALQDIAEIKQPDEFETVSTYGVVQGNGTFAHPSNLLITKSIVLLPGTASGSAVGLRPINRRRYSLLDVTNQGSPSMFNDYNGYYYIAPIPNAAAEGRYLQVAYIRVPALVTDAEGELSPLDRRWDEIVVLGASAKYLRDNNEFERAQAADRDYGRALGVHRSKKAENFAMAGGKGLGLGRRGGSGVASGGWR